MRILFITPYPPSRIRIRSYGFLNQLRREHEVTLLVQVASAQEMADAEALRAWGCEVVMVRVSRIHAMFHSGTALLGSTPLQVAYAKSEDLLQVAQRLCEQRHFDVIHVEHLRGIASVEQLVHRYPLVWDAVDCISLLFEQTMKHGHSLPVRLTAAIDYMRTVRYERTMVRHLPYIVTISERDRQALLDLSGLKASVDDNTDPTDPTDPTEGSTNGDVHIDVVPSGVDLEYFHPGGEQPAPYSVVFSGKMSYHANVAAALYLYNDIMPLVWERRPEVTLTFVGSKPPSSIQRLASDPRIRITGYVDDIRPYIRGAQVMISPMVYSVGLQNKVLEAMALGTPSVISTQSAQALKAVDGSDVIVANSTQAFADAVLMLLNDSELRRKISRNGRRYVERNHNWRVAAEHLENIYRRAMIDKGKLSPLAAHL